MYYTAGESLLGFFWFVLAGRVTTNEELEDMLESGNPSIFISDVSLLALPVHTLFPQSSYLHLVVVEYIVGGVVALLVLLCTQVTGRELPLVFF